MKKKYLPKSKTISMKDYTPKLAVVALGLLEDLLFKSILELCVLHHNFAQFFELLAIKTMIQIGGQTHIW